MRWLLPLVLLSACPSPPDVDGDGSPQGADCVDTDPTIHPGAPEFVDRLDNDCDGRVDEGPTPDLESEEAAARASGGAMGPRLAKVAAAWMADDPARASALWAELLERDHTDGVALRSLAAAELALGDLPSAERRARRAITLAKAANDVLGEQEARTLLGEIQIRSGRSDQAREQFKEGVLRSDDGSTWGCAYQGLGELYSRLDAVNAAAVPSAAEVAAVSPAEAFARGLRGWRAGRLEEATAWAEGAGDAGALLLAILKVQGRQNEPAASLLDGGRVGSWAGRAHLAIAQRDYPGAERALAEAAPVPDVPSGQAAFVAELEQLARGWVHANANEHVEAIERFEALLKGQPDSLLGLLGLGNSQLGDGRIDAAQATFARVLELSPGNPYALAELSVIQLARGETEAAEAGFRRVAEASGEAYTCPYEGLGLVYLKQGRIAEAQAAFETAISINPDIEYKKFNGLARIHLDAGRLDEAEKLLRKSLENFPLGNPATGMLEELAGLR